MSVTARYISSVYGPCRLSCYCARVKLFYGQGRPAIWSGPVPIPSRHRHSPPGFTTLSITAAVQYAQPYHLSSAWDWLIHSISVAPFLTRWWWHWDRGVCECSRHLILPGLLSPQGSSTVGSTVSGRDGGSHCRPLPIQNINYSIGKWNVQYWQTAIMAEPEIIMLVVLEYPCIQSVPDDYGDHNCLK